MCGRIYEQVWHSEASANNWPELVIQDYSRVDLFVVDPKGSQSDAFVKQLPVFFDLCGQILGWRARVDPGANTP